MSTETEHKPNREEGYERRDVNVRALLTFALGLAVLVIVVFFAMRWTFNFLSAKEPLGPPPTPFENARVIPPSPRLQVHPRQDLRSYCDGQLSELNSYGWVDPQAGVVRIPIDRAMDEILRQGLPARPASEATSVAESKAPVGTVLAPGPEGIGGPCSYLFDKDSSAGPR